MEEEIKQATEELEPDKTAKFCETYLQTFNRADAYLACNPESSRASAIANSHRYWKNPIVQAYLRARLSDVVMTSDEVLFRLSEIARGEKGANKQAQLKALELIGKVNAMFTDRTDVTTNGKSISWEQIVNQDGVNTTYPGTLVVEK